MKTIITVILSLVLIGNLLAKDARAEKLKRVTLSSIVKNDEDFIVKWGDKKFLSSFKTSAVYEKGSPEAKAAMKACPKFTKHGYIMVGGKRLEWSGNNIAEISHKKRLHWICSVHMGKDAVIRLIIHVNKN